LILFEIIYTSVMNKARVVFQESLRVFGAACLIYSLSCYHGFENAYILLPLKLNILLRNKTCADG
jgi:hypothetical protein